MWVRVMISATVVVAVVRSGLVGMYPEDSSAHANSSSAPDDEKGATAVETARW